MVEYEKLFAKNLQNKLKKKIVGNIFVKVTKCNSVYVQIFRDGKDAQFKTYLENLSEKLLNGYSVDYAVYEVMTQYREYVKKITEERYFYND